MEGRPGLLRDATGKPGLALITAAVAGDVAALEELLLLHYDRLLRRVARKVPQVYRGSFSEEDVLQQTCTEAFLRIRSFQPKSEAGFYRWLATIADHRLQDCLKAQRTVKRGGGRVAVRDEQENPMDRLLDAVAAPVGTASQSLARREAVSALRVGLASIAEENRRAIQLRYLRGLSVTETAKLMERTPRAVRELCYRGMDELRAVMGRSSRYFSKR